MPKDRSTALEGKQADAIALGRRLEKEVDELRDRKSKLNDAFVYEQVISRKDYEEMRATLGAELATAELNLSRARIDEVEVEKVLDFAENLLLNTTGVWQQCSLDQKQRLQQVLFPQGIEYADGVYRTQEKTFLFKGLEEISHPEKLNGSATGNRGCDPLNFANKTGSFLTLLLVELTAFQKTPDLLTHPFLHKKW